jgi:hypothetical protein
VRESETDANNKVTPPDQNPDYSTNAGTLYRKTLASGKEIVQITPNIECIFGN